MRFLYPPYRNLAGLLALPFLLAFLAADDDFPKRLAERLQAHQMAYPFEKVYLHTDKPYYLAGETIWLKGYLFDGTSHQTDTISTVLYVDLIQVAKQKVFVHKALKATAGFAPGDLPLGDTLPAGQYLLRGYTSWMRNFSDDYYFSKSLTVLNSNPVKTEPVRSDRATPTPAKAATPPDVQFFPEGGQLVNGLEGRVAFKAVDATGKGIDVQGYVLSSAGDTVIGFASQHLGIGNFQIRPETGQQYTAFVKPTGGDFQRYPLPAAQAEGYVMSVDNITNRNNIRVFISNNRPAGTEGRYTLLAHVRGQLIQVAQGAISKKTVIAQLPRQIFPEGIAHLTLFDETGRPVCERIIFVDQNDRLNVSLQPRKASFAPREKVTVDLTVTDPQGKPVRANLSLVATDTNQVRRKESYPSTLVSYLLLSSDLRGTIEQPSYYFDPSHANRLIHLDGLMMTQGWRRFTWPEVLQPTPTAARFPVERGLSLTGQVTRLNQKTPGKVSLTFLLAQPDSTRDILTADSDEEGRFGVYGLRFGDSTRVLVQALGAKNNRNLTITLDNLINPTVKLIQIPYNPMLFQRNELAEFMKRTQEYLDIERQIRQNREILLKEVTVRKKREEPRDSRKIYGHADATLKMDPMITAGAMTILDVIQGRLAGVQVRGSGFNATVQIRGAANFQGIVEPLFVVDGIPMDKSGVMSLSVNDVDYIDVLKGASAAIFGSRGSGGVIAVFTKRGSPNYDFTNEKAPGTLVARLNGYSTVREFYAPRYDTALPEHVRPDYRSTLHWAPLITTGEDGKASVTFFASDARTHIRVVVEGAAPDGRPGAGETVFSVQ